MRIVFISYRYWPPDFGGELLASIARFQSLASKGWSVTVLTSGRPGFPKYQLDQGLFIWRSPIIHRSRLGRLMRRGVFFLWACWKLIRNPCDRLHLDSTGGIGPVSAAIFARILSLVARVKGARSVAVHSLADSETCVFETHGWRGFWRQVFFASFHRVVAVSPALYHGLAEHFPGSATFIPYGIRDDIFAASPKETRAVVRAESGASQGSVIFIFLGSIGRRKGFDLLAQAFAELAPKYPDWRLWVVGPRTRRENQNLDETEVANVTRALEPVADRVTFVGRVDARASLSRILSAADVFVFPSRQEGMPIAPMEAMSVGLPLIISRIPGVTDVASIEGETGLYVPAGDLTGLKAAMLRLGTDAALRQRMGVRAAQVVRAGFAWEQHIAQWMKLYEGGTVAEPRSPEPGKPPV